MHRCSNREVLSHQEHLAGDVSPSPGARARFSLGAHAGVFPAGVAPLRTALGLHAVAAQLSQPVLLPRGLRPLLFAVVEVLALAVGFLPVRTATATLAAVEAEPLDGAIEQLGAAREQRHQAHSKVEAEEDGFLGRAGGKAVYRVGTGEAAAGELGLHLEAVELPLAHQEAHLGQDPEGNVDAVEPPEVEVFPPLPAAAPPAPGSNRLLVVVMDGIHEEDEGGRGDEDDVEDPEPVLGDGEGHVVAHLLAARLQGVAGELLLLILKQVAGDGAEDQNPEDQHDQQPEATQHGRVRLQAVKEATEEAPLSHGGRLVKSERLRGPAALRV